MEAIRVIFTGEYFHALDSKNRLTIPARLREIVNPAVDGYGFYAVPGFEGVLSLYTPRAYTELAGESSPKLFAVRDVRDWRRLQFGLTVYVEVDQLGRVLIPSRTLQHAKVGKNVAIIGVQDHIEVWKRDQWEEFVEQNLASQERLAESALEKERGAE
ncbi:MAG: hypothetical protein QF662_04990 [Phycisphaerae bacterium]|nr:hypothetical protein [Phycisphaerae bacterium]